ncbi:MAG: type III-B CRISPR module RAMP protein Cmr6 [Isosphaeraceae bacterium]
MIWPWRMPRESPWATPYPLPRDTSQALLAEGHCENFGLLMERYLAFGSNRGQVQLVRELADRSALVPDFTKQKELVDAYSARWRNLAEEMGAITFSARPQWRVIMGLGTNDILEGGIVLHPVFGFPILPATSLKGVSRAYAQWVLERPEQELDALLGMVDEDESRCGDLVFLEGSPVTPPVLERDVVNPIFGPYYRDSKTPPANYLSPQPIFFLALDAGSSYQFGVASLSGDQTAARQGVCWLQGALIDLGVGAKSAAGYGYWILDR